MSRTSRPPVSFVTALMAAALLFAPMSRAVEYPNYPGPDPKPAVAPEGWKVETVLRAPQIESPSVVCALPDGRVLVAEDPLDNKGGKEPIDRILCLHPDGKINVFADKLHPVFGLQYMDGKVYVHQYPILTVFTDQDSVGTNPKNLIDHTGQSTLGGLNDHIPAQIRLAMDGFFYMAVGDRGVFGAKSNVDGTTAEIYGGGLIRIRPDGTELSTYATGTRNHLDVSITEEDEMFTYDNTDDGHGWWTRFTHMVDGGFYGYPWDYKPEENKNDPATKKLAKDRDPNVPHQPYTLWRAAEYQGGSPCGATGYNEDALPPEYRNSVFHCEWGKGKVQRFALERDGGTFKVARAEDFLGNAGKAGGDLRPLGISVAADGLGFWVTDWGYGGWHQKKPDVGRLIKVTWTGKDHSTPKPAWYLPAATAKGFTATTAELVVGLWHPAQSVRLVASRRITERGAEAVAPLVAVLNDTKAPPYAKWHAIWTLDKLDGGKAGRDAIIKLVKDAGTDASIRRQAIRQLGERRATDATDAVARALNDADGSIRFRAATALGRIGDVAAVPAILAKLEEKDLFTRFALFTALHRIGKADPKAWPAIVKGLESDSQAVRDNTIYALRDAYDAQLVSALSTLISDKSKPASVRANALLSAAELHRTSKPWDGKWWGTQPVGTPRPAKTVDWDGTTSVANTLQEALRESDPIVRAAAVRAMKLAPDPGAADVLVELFNGEKDIEIRKGILQALAAGKSPQALPMATALLKDAKTDVALIPDAIAVVQGAGGKEAGPALVALVEGNPTVDVLEAAFDALGALKVADAAASIGKHVGHAEPRAWNSAISALGQIGGKPAINALVTALSDKRADVRKAAAVALGTLKAKEAIPALVKVAGDKEIKTEVIATLAKMPSVEALDVYLAVIGGKNRGLSNQGKTALAAIALEAKPLIEAKLDAGQITPEALPEIQEVYARFAPVTSWQMIGPFAIDKPDPFDVATLAKAEGEFPTADGTTAKWKKLSATGEGGMVDLTNAFKSNQGVNAFLLAEVASATDRDVELLTGSDDFSTIWVNGQKVHDDTKSNSGWNRDESRAKARFKTGTNVILARAGNDGGGWQFSLAVGAERAGKIFDAKPTLKKLDRDGYANFALGNKGNAAAGEKIFANANTVGCAKCHGVGPGDAGEAIGPSLLGVGAKYDKAKLIESVLYPSKQIFDGYHQAVVKTKKGDVLYGVVRSETEADLTLYDSAAVRTVLKKSDVATRKTSEVSVMPEGLEQGLTPQEFADLMAYLESLREKPPEPAK